MRRVLCQEDYGGEPKALNHGWVEEEGRLALYGFVMGAGVMQVRMLHVFGTCNLLWNR